MPAEHASATFPAPAWPVQLIQNLSLQQQGQHCRPQSQRKYEVAADLSFKHPNPAWPNPRATGGAINQFGAPPARQTPTDKANIMLLHRPSWLPRAQVPSYVPPPRNTARNNAPTAPSATPTGLEGSATTVTLTAPSNDDLYIKQTHEPFITSGSPELPDAPFSAPEPVRGAVDKEVQFVRHDSDGFRVNGHMLLPGVDERLVMDILTDFDACSRVFHNIERCEAEVLPSGDKKLIQTCSWGIVGFSGSFDCEFNVHEQHDSPTPGEGHVEFNLIKSNFMNHFQGHWHVYPAPSNQPEDHSGLYVSSTAPALAPAPGGCYVEHSMLVKPAVPLPGPVAKFANGIFVSQVQHILDDLEAEVVRRTASVSNGVTHG